MAEQAVGPLNPAELWGVPVCLRDFRSLRHRAYMIIRYVPLKS